MDLNRVTGGGAYESARRSPSSTSLTGKPGKYKVISRSIAYHGTLRMGAGHHRPADVQGAVRAITPGGFRGAQHQFPRPGRPRHRREGVRSVGPTGSPRPSRDGGPRRRGVPGAGAERRRLLPPPPGYFQRVRARSATSTTSCWSPMRPSAHSAGSVRCSPATTSATCPTSSPAPRA